MTRTRRRRLFFLLALLFAGGLYTAYWFTVARLVRENVLEWAGARRAAGYRIGWDRMSITGFPGALTVRLERPVFGQSRQAPAYDASMPALIGEAWPWSPERWRLHAEGGGRLVIAPGVARPAITLSANALDASVELGRPAKPTAPGGTAVALTANDLLVSADETVQIARATADFVVPPEGLVSHRDVWTSGGFRLERIVLPQGVGPLGRTIDSLAAKAAINGTIPPGPHAESLAAWRDGGGTLELESAQLNWRTLSMTANGTFALDRALQPEGALTAMIEGYGAIVDALVAENGIRPGDALLAKLGLAVLAKPGPDGKRQITAPVTIQDGEISIAGFRLGKLPRFDWE